MGACVELVLPDSFIFEDSVLLSVMCCCALLLLIHLCTRRLTMLQVHFEEFVQWWGRFSEDKLQQAWKKTKKGFFRGQPTRQWRQRELAARAQRAQMFADRVRGLSRARAN